MCCDILYFILMCYLDHNRVTRLGGQAIRCIINSVSPTTKRGRHNRKEGEKEKNKENENQTIGFDRNRPIKYQPDVSCVRVSDLPSVLSELSTLSVLSVSVCLSVSLSLRLCQDAVHTTRRLVLN